MVVDPGAGLLEIVVGVSVLGHGPGVPQLVLGLGDGAEYGAGRDPLGIDVCQLHGLLDDGALVVGVVDRIIRIQAQVLAVDAQQLGTE